MSSIQDRLRNLRFDPDTYEFRKAVADRIDELEAALRPENIAATLRESGYDVREGVLSDDPEGIEGERVYFDPAFPGDTRALVVVRPDENETSK